MVAERTNGAGDRGASIDPAEVGRFAAQAGSWWDAEGQFRQLHRLNPLRIAFIRDRLAARHGRDVTRPRPLAGLRILDVGCGGGLLAEPLARLGAEVVGLDASEAGIDAARAHAAVCGLAIDYRCTTAEALVAAGERFDAVLAMEVVEHVADLAAFIRACGSLVRPGGDFVAATLNRTAKAYALAIVGAEYVLGWVPRGTHDWRKFVRPHELARHMRAAGLRPTDVVGVAYDPLADAWRRSRDTDVNYMMAARRTD